MIALLLAALLQGAPAPTATPPATPPAKSVQGAGAEKRGPVCRKETVVGSTIKKKVCPRRVEEPQRGEDEPEKAPAE